MTFDADKCAHELAEAVAESRILKYGDWAPCPHPNPPNTPLRASWLIERNTRVMARYSLYLEARGRLERHPDNPKWIRVLKKGARPGFWHITIGQTTACQMPTRGADDDFRAELGWCACPTREQAERAAEALREFWKNVQVNSGDCPNQKTTAI